MIIVKILMNEDDKKKSYVLVLVLVLVQNLQVHVIHQQKNPKSDHHPPHLQVEHHQKIIIIDKNDEMIIIDLIIINEISIIPLYHVINDLIIIINQLLNIHVLLILIQFLLQKKITIIIHLVHRIIHNQGQIIIESKKPNLFSRDNILME